MTAFPLKIIPFKQVGNICKGDTLSVIIDKFLPHEVFKKVKEGNIVSVILDGSTHVYYDKNGLCEGVEIMAPYLPSHDYTLVWEDINFFNLNIAELKQALETKNYLVTVDSYGLDIPELGFATYTSHLENGLNTQIDAVYVNFERPQEKPPKKD